MNKSSNKSQVTINKKTSRKFSDILGQLAKSDTSLINKMKVTVFKEDIIDEKKQIAPSTFMNSHKHFIYRNSNEDAIVNVIEDSVLESEALTTQNAELINYPDSSDFDEDE